MHYSVQNLKIKFSKSQSFRVSNFRISSFRKRSTPFPGILMFTMNWCFRELISVSSCIQIQQQWLWGSWTSPKIKTDEAFSFLGKWKSKVTSPMWSTIIILSFFSFSWLFQRCKFWIKMRPQTHQSNVDIFHICYRAPYIPYRSLHINYFNPYRIS